MTVWDEKLRAEKAVEQWNFWETRAREAEAANAILTEQVARLQRRIGDAQNALTGDREVKP